MALPADMHEQISRREARLRLVPADETPPAQETRRQVQRWQEHVHEAAETMRWADATIAQMAGLSESGERDRLLSLVRSVRAEAFALMQRLNPDQAWFWTEHWQAGERDVDRDIAAGLLISGTLEEFDAALDVADAQRAHAD